MLTNKNQAFTIIETVLFLALSGAIFLIVFRSINNSISNTQFIESARDLQSQIQLQYNEVVNGVSDGISYDCKINGAYSIKFNTGDSSSGDNKNCINLGKAISVYNDRLEVHSLVGRRLDSGDLDNSDINLISASTPTIYKDNGTPNPKTIETRWDTTIERMVVSSSSSTIFDRNSGDPISHFAFIRSPSSSKILVAAYKSKLPSTLDSSSSQKYRSSTMVYGANVQLCLKGDNKFALIDTGRFNNSSSVDLDLSEPAKGGC